MKGTAGVYQVEERREGCFVKRDEWWAVPWIFAHSGQLFAIYSKLRWTKELLTDPCRLFIPSEKGWKRSGEISREPQRSRIRGANEKADLFRNLYIATLCNVKFYKTS